MGYRPGACKAGADVAINDRERTAQADTTVAEILALGRRSALVEGDIFQRSCCEQVVAQAIQVLGRIDIQVSNPAFNRHADCLDSAPETFSRVIDGTLTSWFHMAQFVDRHMVELGGGGKIVFISSVHVQTPYARNVASNAA